MQALVQDDFIDGVLNLGTRLSNVELSAVNDALPIGALIQWPLSAALLPSNWVLGLGQAIDRITYGTLFSEYGTSFGVGDGATTFNVPNYTFAKVSMPEVSYVAISGSISLTATTEAAATSIVDAAPIVCNGADAYWIEFYAPYFVPPSSAGFYSYFPLFDNGVSIGYLGLFETPASGADYKPLFMKRRIVPTAGTHTFGIRGFGPSPSTVGVGGGTISDFANGYINISCVPSASTSIAIKAA